MAASRLTFRQYAILGIVTLTSSLGDTFLSVGMKQIGPVPLSDLALLLHALANPWVMCGITLLIGFFASYLTALSWADLTYVLPATSLGYVIVALLSRFWLHEFISPGRWIGIALITTGVGFVTRGPAYTAPMSEEVPKEPARAQHTPAPGKPSMRGLS